MFSSSKRKATTHEDDIGASPVTDISSIPRETFDAKAADIIKMPMYKANRDVKRHAARLKNLPEFDANHPTIPVGFAVINLKGVDYLGNGNTRVELEKTGVIKLPALLAGIVRFRCRNKEEAEQVYNGYDNPITAKDQQDRGITALKQNGFVPEKMHALFQKGRFVSGLTFADAYTTGRQTASVFSRADATAMVARFRSEIEEANDILLEAQVPVNNRTACSAGIIAGVFVTLTPGNPLHDDASEFWPRFFKSSGRDGDAKAAENYLWRGAELRLTKQTKKHRERSFLIRDEAIYAVNHCNGKISKHFPQGKKTGSID